MQTDRHRLADMAKYVSCNDGTVATAIAIKLDGRLINDGQRWDKGVAVNQHRKPTSRTATQAYPGMTHATWHGHVARSIY